MTHASLFSGIGGCEVAAAMMGWENLFHCEINPFGRAVLDYWFPKSKSYEDITKTNFNEWLGKVDVLTGGFPCQPFSYAGQRRGSDDDRYLWPQMLRAIEECKPTWVIGENVAGITTMVEQGEIVEVGNQTSLWGETDTLRSYEMRSRFTLERVCSDLERIGYEVQPILVPACAVGAPHRRDRVFILGHIRDASDTDGGGEGAHGASGCTQAVGSHADAVTGERLAETERHHGLHEVSRPLADMQKQQSQSSDGLRAAGAERQEQSRGRGGENDARGNHSNANESLLEGRNESQPSSTQSRLGTQSLGEEKRREVINDFGLGQRWAEFPSISPVHRGNDGLPFDVDDIAFPFDIGAKDPFVYWRTESLKAYGNAIVPQVVYEIFRAIEQINSRDCLDIASTMAR